MTAAGVSVAALLVAVAGVVVLWPRPKVHHRLSSVVPSAPVTGRHRDPWQTVWTLPVAALVFFGVAPAMAGLLVAGLVSRQRRRARRQADDDRDTRDLVAALGVIGAELSVGAPVVHACRAAAHELAESGSDGPVGPELARMAARAELGGDPGAANSLTQAVHRLARVWSTSLQFGLPVGDVVAALRADIVARREFTARTRAGLAGPRATAAVLAGLPLLGIGLGEAMGAGPLRILLHTGVGGILLVIGTALCVGGVRWAEYITDRAVEP